MKWIPHPPIRPPPKLRKISVVNKSRNEEEAFELRSQLEEISILVSMSLSPINLKCWILQNVMLYLGKSPNTAKKKKKHKSVPVKVP